MFKRTFLAIAVGAFLSSGLVQAAPQFGSSPAQAQSSTQAPAAHAAPAATKTNDALINQIAANGAKDQQAVKVLSAKERANSFLAAQVERGVLEAGPGWNEEQQVYIAIGTAVVPMDSIKSAADFVRIRNLKADEAELLAKAEIIRFVRTSMSVENRLVLPQTEPQTDFDKELKALQDESEAARKQISASRQGWLPNLEVGYRRNTETRHPLNGIVVGFSFPLFENRHKVKAAKSLALSTDYLQENARMQASSALWQLYEEASQLQQSIQEYQDTFARQRDLALLRKALEGGEISMIEYFVEVSVVYQSKANLLQLENQYQKAMARIYKSQL